MSSEALPTPELECPADDCERTDFDDERSLKIHYGHAHDGSLAWNKIELECNWCNETYTDWEYRADDRVYCSRSCRQEQRLNNDFRKTRENRTCDECDTTFKTTPASKQRFCSKSCSESVSGQDHPLWRGGVDIVDATRKQLSDESWNSISNKQREETPECEQCGATDDEAKLDVHHIIPVRTGGTNEDWNLMVLCDSCHTTTENYTDDIVDTHIIPDEHQ